MDSQLDRSGQAYSSDVTKAARCLLQKSPYGIVRRISCEYDGGVLVLKGRLPSYYHKQVAQEAVVDLRGVQQVHNEIEVVT